MNIIITEEDSKIKITMSGFADMTGMKELAEELDKVPAFNLDVEFDLSAVEYLDSSCIGLLIKLNKIQKNKGLGFRITAASERVSSVLSLCSLSSSLGV